MSSLSPQAMGRGTTRRVVEGPFGVRMAPPPRSAVPLPTRFARREESPE